MELAGFLPLLFVRMSLFALWNASPSRQTQREGYNSENVIDLLEALNVTRGGVRGVTKVKGQEAGLVAWRFRSRTPHLTLPQEHTRYLLSSTHGSLGLHLIGQQTRQTTATLLSLMSRGQMLLRLVSCTRSNTLRLEYPTHTHSQSETHKHSDTNTHTLLLPGGSPFTGGGWVQLALGFEAKMLTLFTDCRQDVVVELSQPDEVINLRLPLDLQVTFASEAEEPNSKFSGSWQTAEISTRAYQRRPWQCPNLTEPLPPPTSQTVLPEGSTVPIMLLDEKVGVANDQPQRVVLGAPGKKTQSPTHTPANAEAQTHTGHGDRISRLEERLDGVSTMLEMLKNQNMELAERVRYLESCECVRRVCVWEGVEVESGKSWTTDKHSLCTCTNGQVQCSSTKDPCSSAPCLNGGVCEVTTPDLGFVCSCPPSAEGRLCEKPRSSVSTQACFMPALKGSCLDRAEPVQRWFHNPASSSCEPFLFSGCHGNANNFLTRQACEAQCMLGACCYRLTGSDRSRHRDHNSSSIPEPATWGTEWAGPGLNASLGVWHNCGSGPINCEHVSISQCQQKGTAVSFSPGRPCPAMGCVSSRAVCMCVFNGRSFRPGEAFEVGCEACVCTYRGVIECTCRSPQPRKEIRDLSQSEMREYQHAVQTLYLQPECVYEGKTYRTGEEFKPDSCSACVCENGQMNCIRVSCSSLSCRDQYIPEGGCCPVCRSGCEHEEAWYENGDVFVSQASPCLNCSCTNNQVKCLPIQCPRPRCSNPFKLPGECCPTCTACDLDGRPNNNTIISTLDGCQTCTCQKGIVSCDVIQRCTQRCVDDRLCCRHQPGLVLLDGVAFPDPRDSCRRCICTEGSVMCTGVACPPLDCTLVETVGGVCCPRCRSCVLDGIWHEHGSQWSHPDSPCNLCTCVEGQVRCERQDCSPPCPFPTSPRPGTCCPVCNGCGVNGLDFLNGDRVPSGDRCEECVCVNGDMHCKPLPCPATPCPRPIKRPGECCPRCEQCEYESQVYADGQNFPSRTDPCLSCRCSAGEVKCDRLDSRCPAVHCTHPAKPQGHCCASCEMCEYERQLYVDGKVFNPPGSGPCVQCTCKGGSVRCHKQRCPPVSCPNPIRDPQLCCPVCKVCVLDGVELEEGSEWENDCNRCVCENGQLVCRSAYCPPITCQHPTKTNGDCCAACDRCSYNNRIYENGQAFTDPDNPCQRCMCQDGTMACTTVDCPRLTCSKPYRPPGECCARCPDCDFENRVFVNGEEFPNPLHPCEDCVCVDGAVNCKTHQCPTPTCHYPLPASCCQNNCNGCSYAGKEYPNGAEFPHPTDKCRTCHCINGNVQCLLKRCPALPCTNPVSVLGECCPQCPAPPANCVYVGHTYIHNQRFYHPTDSCQSCSCTNGTVSCVRKPCPPALCVHPIQQDCCRTCDGCLYDGKELPNGGVFPDVSDPCGVCVCREGTVTCERKRCPLITCPFPVQRECCQSCDGCLYVGVEYQSGQEFADPSSECSVCVCVNGRVTCNPKPCYNPGCTHPVKLPGQCCPVCDGCVYENTVMLNGQVFPDARDSCSECTCRTGSVQCTRKMCLTAPCPHPVSGPCDCPVCEGCVFQGGVYVDGQSFSAPKADCDVCTCSKGRVTCAPRVCAKVSCPHPALDGCLCGVCEGCRFHQRDCGNRERFRHPEDPCQRCTCLNGGVTCVPVPCPAVACAQPVTPPGECCPMCTGVCEHLGRVYESGRTFTNPNDRCSTCTCLNEVVSCQRKPCTTQCSNPVAIRDCCPVCESCVYEGKEYAHKQSFTPPGFPCERCMCLSGSVTCTPRICPVLTCLKLHTRPGQCCPECRVCSQNGVEYPEGQTWNPKDQPCQKCTCAFGEVVCVGPPCPVLTCMSKVTDPDSCCPRCKGCVYNGVEHFEGSEWFDPASPCMNCMCVEGVTTCSEIRCISLCTHTINVPGECCPVCADCISDGKVYEPGDTFHPADDPCKICVCEEMPDGKQHLRCIRKQCPSLVDCAKENILYTPDSCCPVCAQPLSNCTATLIGNEVLSPHDQCYTCQCKDLTWTCMHQTCVPLTCPLQEQYTPPDSCCAVCDVCLIEGGRERVPNGHKWIDGTNECITCTCNLGYIECEIEECVPMVCEEGLVKIKLPGKCCPECQGSGASCEYQGDVYSSNEHWEVDECTSCTCVSGDVHCQTERCPPANCAADETPALIPGMCCPHCLPRPATCIAFGDPHYRTFDGRMVNFQGTCTYVLTEDCHGGDFSIHVTNDARGRKGVSWTKEVTLFIADITVSLLQNWVVKVDSKVVSLPYLKEPYVYVERKTNTILLNTNIGLKVKWNGRSHLEVSVPGTYKKHTCGLCGNFNNYPQDDLRLRNGQVTTSEAAFGNNWRVDRRNSSSACVLESKDVNPCKSAGYSARKSANARCAVLKGSMFERCHKVVPPEMFYAACVYDLCACGANSEECLCDALEAYASECREAGVILQWRSSSLCAVGCPVDRGFVFDECGPPCAVTCVTRDVPLGVIEAQCFKPCVPGCQCPAGRVLHDNHCVRPDKCPNIIHNTT